MNQKRGTRISNVTLEMRFVRWRRRTSSARPFSLPPFATPSNDGDSHDPVRRDSRNSRGYITRSISLPLSPLARSIEAGFCVRGERRAMNDENERESH